MEPKDISSKSAGAACGCHVYLKKPAGHKGKANLARRSFLRNAAGGSVLLLAVPRSRARGRHLPRVH